MSLFRRKAEMVDPDSALPGRSTRMPLAAQHFVLRSPLTPPFPAGAVEAQFGMGCFWGAERLFWKIPGVVSTSVGYAGGYTPNPSYEEVCSGRTGHTEIVRVFFDPAQVSYDALLKTFWERHDPTQGLRQGNDIGSQYRSAIYCIDDAQMTAAEASRERYQRGLDAAKLGSITTEIRPAPEFFAAEDYHQQYLAKNPDGYCGLGGTGVVCVV
ncbi:MAG: peptide-methionine (S)-S-oxide reductase MsrA [Proteobacteria bacterium]|nr:peptide-methionine (S)-S-oxide reductase MsrA [Pseudomonadota bacterium]